MLVSRIPGRRRQRGLSLVEMMVGVTIGLVVVAGASLLMSTQLLENRRLLIETQLQQDLRASADIMARELRRAGSQRDPGVLRTLWLPGGGMQQHNVFSDTLTVTGSNVSFWYQPPVGPDPTLGFRLEGNVLQRRDGSGGWQELSDSNVMRILAPSASAPPTFDAVTVATIKLPCNKLCTDGSTDCWPTVQVRKLVVTLTGQAKNMPEVERMVRSRVRVRNDNVVFPDASANQVCPV